jgi:hypothetical protein
MKEKKIIGRKDRVNFPKLGLENVLVKIDTGAYTSSIHCHHIEEIEIDGQKAIRFELFDPDHKHYIDKPFIVTNYLQKKIKSSTGHCTKRFIIKTNIQLFDMVYPIDLSLSERGTMKHPILIGRKLLNRRFIVDTTKINLSFKYRHK